MVVATIRVGGSDRPRGQLLQLPGLLLDEGIRTHFDEASALGERRN